MHESPAAAGILRLSLPRFQGNIGNSRSVTKHHMARSVRTFLPVALLLWAIPQAARSQQPTGAGTAGEPSSSRAAAPAPAPAPAAGPKPTLADFAWLEGHWQGTWGPRLAQQAWMAPKAGVMLGTFQLTENDKTLVLEVFTLIEGPAGIELRIRHLTPSLVTWEKNGPTVLPLVGTDPKTFTFENPTNGQPKRSIIRRVDADTFVSRSEILPEKGETQVTEITYHRMREIPPAKNKR